MNCLNEHTHPFFIECTPAQGQVQGFPLPHLVRYFLEANPDLDGSPAAPPERLLLQFSTHHVRIAGWHLQAILQLLRAGKTFSLQALDSRYLDLNTKTPFVTEIAVSEA